MSPLLQQFNNDVHTRDEVIGFIHNFIDQEALRKLYKKEDVSAMSEARTLIDSAFDNLNELYGIKIPAKKKINQAK